MTARLKRLVYGTKQPRIGADGSWIAMFRKDEFTKLADLREAGPTAVSDGCACSWCGQSVSRDLKGTAIIQPIGPHPFHPNISVTSGILQDECAELMRGFFRARRQQGGLIKMPEG